MKHSAIALNRVLGAPGASFIGAALLGLSLAGCATVKPEPVVKTVEVKVPVAVACVPKDLGPAPAYPDTGAALKAAPGAADRYQLLAAGRLLRSQRLAELEPVIQGCR